MELVGVVIIFGIMAALTVNKRTKMTGRPLIRPIGNATMPDITGLLPFLFVSILFGLKKTSRAFSVPLKKESEKDKLIQALTFLKMYGTTTWLTGLIGVIMGVVTMLANLASAVLNYSFFL
jgi:hypothetical protein